METRPILINTAKFSIMAMLGLFMFGFILASPPSLIDGFGDILLTAGLFSALYIFGLVLISINSKLDFVPLLFAAAVLAALIYIRVSLLGFRSGDYNSFLQHWVSKMQSLSIRGALCEKIGDYNMPYLYFLLAVAKLGANPLILIKWFSCLFDIITAFFVMKCVGLKTEKCETRLFSFLLTLALPTVFVNSAYWGQCDSILAAFIVMSVYFALKSNGVGAMVCYALAFSIKLQAIFILPIIIVCFLSKRFKIWTVLLFPLVFLSTLLPALIAGRGFIDCVRIYFDQANQYAKMTLNAPNLWQLFGEVNFEVFENVAIMLGGIAFISLIFIGYKYKNKIDRGLLLELFYISVLALPFILPRMHERYFFLADILSVLIFFYDKKRWYLPLVTVLCSLNAYFAFLGGMVFEQKYAAVALLVLLILSVKKFFEKVCVVDETH